MQISLCMIVKNEEDILARCLSSIASVVDEIIIVDTGSTDDTVKIAKEYGAKIFHFKWCDDFAKARNYSFSKATKDYILWLDADDYLTEENVLKLLKIKETITEGTDIVSMVYSLIRDLEGRTTSALRRNRIVKRKNDHEWVGRIHEYLKVAGNTLHSDIEVFHDKHKEYSDRNLRIFRQMKKDGDLFSVRDQYYFANELYYNNLLEEAIEEYFNFLGTGNGWIEDRRIATINLVSCLNRTKRTDEIMDVILETFKWGKPHAELCCRFAECFMREKRIPETIFWYETALRSSPDEDNMALAESDYYTFIPAIQLCVFYSRLGEFETAQRYNELAAKYKPDSPFVDHNRDFLKSHLKSEE